MRAVLVKPEARSIDAVDLDLEGRDDIARLIGYDTLESDTVGDGDGDTLHDAATSIDDLRARIRYL